MKLREYNVGFLFFSSLYLSGIVYIGTQALFGIDWIRALILGAFCFILYLCWVILSSLIVNVLYHEVESDVRKQKVAILVGAVSTAFAFPFSVLLSYLSIGEIGSPRYYFYAIMFALIVFVTATIYKGGFEPLSTKKKEVLKAQIDLQVEILKGLITAFSLVLLGTAYSQVLTGIMISTEEMILVFYTSVGIIIFVLAPLIRSLLDLLQKLSEVT